MAEDIKILTDENLKVFGKKYTQILIKGLMADKKRASGKLIKSISYRLVDTANAINVILDGEDYLKYVDEGRKRGSYPPIQAIAKWASIKGIKGAEYAIAKNIYKFGIKPTNIIQETITKIENTASKYEDIIAKNVEDALYNNIIKNTK